MSKVSWSRTASGHSIGEVDDIAMRVECESGPDAMCEWTLSGFAPSRDVARSRAERAALAVGLRHVPDQYIDALMVAAQEGRAYIVVNGVRDTLTLFSLLKKLNQKKK